eukprot:GHVU01207134.1.p2 GENE.GHVU01207134.1~~GHVU01207134.1.p2  ORF type:complete len:110 (+),score=3.37 GHVU01207134.1:116-445(+)
MAFISRSRRSTDLSIVIKYAVSFVPAQAFLSAGPTVMQDDMHPHRKETDTERPAPPPHRASSTDARCNITVNARSLPNEPGALPPPLLGSSWSRADCSFAGSRNKSGRK